MNTLIVEWEATFPFSRHAIISNRYAYTRREIAGFVGHCDKKGIEVIPLQQCFGHLEYILQHPRYAHLRESQNDLCQLCPCKSAEAVTVFRQIFREVARAHPSPYFHIGGDETYLLGHCPACRVRSGQQGASHLYVEYLRRMAKEVISLGKRPLLWIDVLLKHPEAAARMPRQSVFVDWNYGWPLNRFGDFSRLAALPFEFWGAAAMRSAPDNHSCFSWKTHFENLRDYVPAARERNFRAIILTSWSTSGLYGYEWETAGRVQKIWPVRRTVPHVALPILVAAFAEAVRYSAPLDIETFVFTYASERFGFSPFDATAFREALALSEILDRSGARLTKQVQNLTKSRRIFDRLQPRRNRLEFERYALMTLLAEHQLKVLRVEARAQTARLGNIALQRQTGTLLHQAEELDRRYTQVFAHELHPGELRDEKEFRSKALRQLHHRLTRSGRKALPPDPLQLNLRVPF
jgi:hexosaminidase